MRPVPWAGNLGMLMSRWWFAYPTIWLLQLKVIWGDWTFRDIGSGDTSSYFINAARWFYAYSIDFMWSPLYGAFYGSLFHLSKDAYVVTELHRLIIVFVGVTLFLTVMRRLLPHGLAWILAAWWATLDINYNVMYEVHLFGVLFILGTLAAILTTGGPWSRGTGIAILLLAAVLVRNELSVSTGALAAILVAWEVWRAYRRRPDGKRDGWSALQRVIPAYAVPLVLSGAIILFFFSRSYVQPPRLSERSVEKHTVNLCQVYAYGYQERYPGVWPHSPWTDCYDLMQEHFGKRLPTFGETLQSNQSAALDHVFWNLALTNAGIQASLFNAISGPRSPDFVPFPRSTLLVRMLSATIAIILAIGAVLLYRERSFWWKSYLQQRVWGWITLALLAGPSLLIIPIVRPRPEYLYGLTFLIMAALGMSGAIIMRRWISAERFQAIAPALVVLALLLVPNHYADPARRKPQTYRTMYDRLEPFVPLLARPDAVILQPGFDEFENYAAGLQLVLPGEDKSVVRPLMGKPVHYMTLSERQPREPFEQFLDRRGINYVYMNEDLLATLDQDPLARTMLDSPASLGWKVIGSQEVGNTRWRLLQKTAQTKSAGDDRFDLSAAIAPQTD